MNSLDEKTALVPPGAADAVSMALRVMAIAAAMQTLGVKPSSLQCGNGYLWGADGDPDAEDMVCVQVEAVDFATVEQAFGLSRSDDRDTNVYASGVHLGVAVLAFCSAADLAAVQS